MSHRPGIAGADRALLDLIGAVLDGGATAEQRAALNERLASDAHARAAYRRYVNLHVALKTYHPALTAMPLRRGDAPSHTCAEAPAAAAAATRDPSWWRSLRLRLLVAAVSGAAAAAVLIAMFVRPRIGTTPAVRSTAAGAGAEDVVVAHITRVTQARFNGRAEAPVVGAEVRAGTLELADGFAEITLTNGVRMVLEAPVKVELPASKGATLRSGRLVATVPEGARGFSIDTPRARVVDLGTEFGVGVRESGDTEVQVFRGVVVTQWQGPEGHKVDQQLTAGNAVSIEASAKSAPRGIPFEPERFVRMFPTDADSGDLGGPIYNRSRFSTVHVVPRPAHQITIDGDLSDWDRSGAFYSACLPPYHESHYVEGMMMYDREYLYLGAHVGDPAPMRSTMDPPAGRDQYAWRGGSVIVRLCVDPKLGWPLPSLGKPEADFTRADAGTRPEDVSEQIVHATMWYHRTSGRARLLLSYGMDFHGERTDPPAWEGSFKMDPNGLGYTLEYAIPWSLLNASARPPQAGDQLAACWTVHWSDQEGKFSRGHLVEITNPQAGPFRFLRASTWGKAIYHDRGALPPNTVTPTTGPAAEPTFPVNIPSTPR